MPANDLWRGTFRGARFFGPLRTELAREGPVILTCDGKPLAAVRDLSGSDWEVVSLANNPQFLALIEESRRAYGEEGGTSLNDLCQELGLKTTPRTPKRKKKPRRPPREAK